MYKKKPEGYKDLLVYKKSEAIHLLTLKVVSFFPKSKTMIDLADQMSRSARSVVKNIIEGWKRNTTAEYFQFLGFSLGSNTELMDDAADVATGKYKDLMGIKGIMGEMGIHTRDSLNKLPFYPLNPGLPLSAQLFLQCKEVNYLLYRVQQSLDVKMNAEGTKTQKQKLQAFLQDQKQENTIFNELLKDFGLQKSSDGKITKQND